MMPDLFSFSFIYVINIILVFLRSRGGFDRYDSDRGDRGDRGYGGFRDRGDRG